MDGQIHHLPVVVLVTARSMLLERWNPRPGRHNSLVFHLDPLDGHIRIARVADADAADETVQLDPLDLHIGLDALTLQPADQNLARCGPAIQIEGGRQQGHDHEHGEQAQAQSTPQAALAPDAWGSVGRSGRNFGQTGTPYRLRTDRRTTIATLDANTSLKRRRQARTLRPSQPSWATRGRACVSIA